ncbi:MAG: hypothetical protein ACLRWA_06320 [Lachnospira sp.]
MQTIIDAGMVPGTAINPGTSVVNWCLKCSGLSKRCL